MTTRSTKMINTQMHETMLTSSSPGSPASARIRGESMINPAPFGSQKAPGGFAARRERWGLKQLADQHEGENNRREGDAFDQCGGDDHVGADLAGGFGLAGDAFDGLAADLTDAPAGADDAQSHADGRSADRH